LPVCRSPATTMPTPMHKERHTDVLPPQEEVATG
jgi:hypothetical protein